MPARAEPGSAPQQLRGDAYACLNVGRFTVDGNCGVKWKWNGGAAAAHLDMRPIPAHLGRSLAPTLIVSEDW